MANISLRYTNAPWLVIENPGGADDGLFARNAAGTAAGLGRAHRNAHAGALAPMRSARR